MSLSALSIVFVCGEDFQLLRERLGLNRSDQSQQNISALGIRIQQSKDIPLVFVRIAIECEEINLFAIF